MHRLAPFFSGFQELVEVGERKNRPVRLDPASFKGVLERGVNRTDVGNEVIKELGYQIGLSAQSSAFPGDIDVAINVAVTSPAVHNEVSITLGAFDQVPAKLVAAIDWIGILELIVDVWSPDCGSLVTAELEGRPRLRRALTVGWLTYLSAGQYPQLPPLPREATVKPIRSVGNLIAAMPDAFPHHAKKDLALLNQVHRSLARLYLNVKSL
jgi:hypothetical protein